MLGTPAEHVGGYIDLYTNAFAKSELSAANQAEGHVQQAVCYSGDVQWQKAMDEIRHAKSMVRVGDGILPCRVLVNVSSLALPQT